ncbi:MAG: dockerin type I repeat-containing protein, partial [Clostridia bacterium]|nr:dockerin type I repeat-containing protein [Clostridia bacterium]
SPVIMNSVAFTVRKFTTFVSISNEAALVQSKDGDLFNRLPVTLEGKEEYNIDDILKAAHEQYADAEHGYSSADSGFGLSITKLWGDESGACGYWQNDNSAWSLGDKVSDGDFISAFVYKDRTGWSDAYTKFADNPVTAPAKSEITFTLQKFDWSAYAFIPCVGAEVSVIGLTDVGGTTDENGAVTLVIPTEGTYTAIAQSADIPIVPTSCTITLSAPLAAVGDVNGDGDIDFADAILILKYDAGISQIAADYLSVADVNFDGDVDFADAILILKYDAGLIESLN